MTQEEELSAMQTSISYLENQMKEFQTYNNYDDFEDCILCTEEKNEELLIGITRNELRKTKGEFVQLKETILQKETENAQKEKSIHTHDHEETLTKDFCVKKDALNKQSAEYNDSVGAIKNYQRKIKNYLNINIASVS